jgi:hypothetical protein
METMKVLSSFVLTFLLIVPPQVLFSGDSLSYRYSGRMAISGMSSENSIEFSEEEKILGLYAENSWPHEVNDLIVSWQSLGGFLQSWKDELRSVELTISDLSSWYNGLDGLQQELDYYKAGEAIAIQKIEELQSDLPTASLSGKEQLLNDINYWQKEREYLTSQVENLSRELQLFERNLNRKAELAKAVSKGEEIYAQMELSIHEQVQQDLRSHAMRLNLGYVFGILVTVLIMAFFYIADKHHHIATAIFAGPSGIQFITLFLLVMALAIFGLTQILEGKELAALLGSISGYILGRGLSKGSSAQVSDELPENS